MIPCLSCLPKWYWAGINCHSETNQRIQQLPIGQLYTGLFSKPTIQSAVDQAVGVAAKYGISGHAAALRWTAYHSQLDHDKGDAIIIGSSSPAQLSSNLDTIDEGPLPQEVVEAINGISGQLRPEDDIPYSYTPSG